MSAEVQTKVHVAQIFSPVGTGLLQRMHTLSNIPGLVKDRSKRDEEELTRQRSPVNHAGPVTAPLIVHEVLRTQGRPLDSATRTFMEPRFGHDFSRVLVHSTGPGMIQAKLKINEPGDIYEQEADRVAEAVMRMPNNTAISNQRSATSGGNNQVKMRPVWPFAKGPLLGEEEIRKKPMEITPLVQRKVENAKVSSDIESDINAFKGSGQSLPQSLKDYFGPRFGYDFSGVRVHTDTQAALAAQALNGRAFTAGRDIFFDEQEFQPATHTGRRLLAHELAHTVQQAASRFPDGQTILQRTIGDGHDLSNPRFSGEPRLEAAFDNETVIAVGSCGDHVRIIQEALLDLGFDLPKFGADCVFGSETQKAVADFQTQNSAVIDGAVGFETMGLLDTLTPTGPPPAIECPQCQLPLPPPPPPPPPHTEKPVPRCECNPNIVPEVWAQCGVDPTTGEAVPCIPIRPGEKRCGVCKKPRGKQYDCNRAAREQFDKEIEICDAKEQRAFVDCIAAKAQCVASGFTNISACAKAGFCAGAGPHFERVECEKKADREFNKAKKECKEIPDL